MRITHNTSVYDTRALRSIICLVHQHMTKLECRPAPNWKTLRVRVRGRARGRHVSGRAYYRGRGPRFYDKQYDKRHGWDVLLTLPEGLTKMRLAYLVYHELMHTYGYPHGAYYDIPEAELLTVLGAQATELLPTREVREKVPRDLRAERIRRLLLRQSRWESRAKRARTELKKIAASLRGYERRAPEALAAQRGKLRRES